MALAAVRDVVEDGPIKGGAVAAVLGAAEELVWRAQDGSVPPEREVACPALISSTASDTRKNAKSGSRSTVNS